MEKQAKKVSTFFLCLYLVLNIQESIVYSTHQTIRFSMLHKNPNILLKKNAAYRFAAELNDATQCSAEKTSFE
jgi:hypothetical protein